MTERKAHADMERDLVERQRRPGSSRDSRGRKSAAALPPISTTTRSRRSPLPVCGCRSSVVSSRMPSSLPCSTISSRRSSSRSNASGTCSSSCGRRHSTATASRQPSACIWSRSAEQVPLRFHIDDRLSAQPAPEARLILYRIAQEALTNVRKHAKAQSVHGHAGAAGGLLSRPHRRRRHRVLGRRGSDPPRAHRAGRDARASRARRWLAADRERGGRRERPSSSRSRSRRMPAARLRTARSQPSPTARRASAGASPRSRAGTRARPPARRRYRCLPPRRRAGRARS